MRVVKDKKESDRPQEQLDWMTMFEPTLIVLLIFMMFWMFLLPLAKREVGFSAGDYAIALPTTVLAVATLLNAMVALRQIRMSKTLADVTVQTHKMQEDREQRDAALLEFNRLKRKIELAEGIVGSKANNLFGPLSNGYLPNPESGQIREIACLLNYPTDGVDKETLTTLLAIFDMVALGDTHPEITAIQVSTPFENLRTGVYKAFPGWRTRLLELSAVMSQGASGLTENIPQKKV